VFSGAGSPRTAGGAALAMLRGCLPGCPVQPTLGGDDDFLAAVTECLAMSRSDSPS